MMKCITSRTRQKYLFSLWT